VLGGRDKKMFEMSYTSPGAEKPTGKPGNFPVDLCPITNFEAAN